MSERRFKSKKLIILSSLILCFLFLFYTVDSVAIDNPDYVKDIPAGGRWMFGSYLSTRAELTVEFEVIEGGNKDIDIYIIDSENHDKLIQGYDFTYIKYYQRVISGTIGFTPEEDGNYWFVFDNTFSIFTSKIVEIKATVVSLEEKSIQINYPSSYTFFYIEEDDYYNCPIRWQTTGDITYVTIELYKEDYYMKTITTGTANDGYYEWKIYYSDGYDRSNYKIKISDYYDGSIYDFSDYYFEIRLEEARTIQVNYPISTTYDVYETESCPFYISWDYTGDIDYVTIELYRGTTLVKTIASYTINTGSYEWKIYYSDGYSGSNYRIKISDYYDGSVYDFSDYFEIENHSFLERILPLILVIGILISIFVISIIIVVHHKRKKKREISPVKEELTKSNIKICSQCGSKIKDDEIFCGSCGRKI